MATSNKTIKPIKKGLAVFKDITQTYDDILPIDSLNFSEENLRIYGDYSEEHVIDLKDSIVAYGLYKPIVLFNDKKTIESGHNRIKALKMLGYTHVPILYSDLSNENSYKTMISLAMENMGRPFNWEQSHNAIKQTVCAHEEEFGVSPSNVEIEGYCKLHKMSLVSYNRLNKLELEAPELYTKVIADKLALTAAVEELRDINRSAVTLTRTPHMNTLVNADDTMFGINRVVGFVNYLESYEYFLPSGERTKFQSADVATNIMSGVGHDLFTNAIRDIINHKDKKKNSAKVTVEYKGLAARAEKNNNLYDIEIPRFNSGIETKTCVTESGKKPRWVTNRYKDGYYCLLTLNPDGTRAFAGYGILKREVWKRGRIVGTLSVEQLYEAIQDGEFTVHIGSITVQKGNVVVELDPLSH
jgi:hypothetical protein